MNKSLPQTLTLDHVSPATRLLEKRRQMFEVQEALDAQKEEFARREEAFRRREEGLRKKDLELQESLIKFNKFLQENESKRTRAEKRASEEAKQGKQKEEEIFRLKGMLQEMNDQSRKLQTTVEKNMKYQKYLEVVQEAVPEDYPEISDLLNRYKTLQDANTDLTLRQRRHEELNEQKRAQFSNYTKERTNEILNFNNEIAFLQKELETAESTAIRLQNEVETSMRSMSDKTLELGQVLMAVENLLQRCTSKRHGAILKHTETKKDDQQNQMKVAVKTDETTRKGRQAMVDLEVISAYMVDFAQICNVG